MGRTATITETASQFTTADPTIASMPSRQTLGWSLCSDNAENVDCGRFAVSMLHLNKTLVTTSPNCASHRAAPSPILGWIQSTAVRMDLLRVCRSVLRSGPESAERELRLQALLS